MITTNDILKFLNGDSSKEEQLLLEQWIANSEENAAEFEQFKLINDHSNHLGNYIVNDVDAEWMAFEKLTGTSASIKSIDSKRNKTAAASKSWFRPMAIAASFALMLSAFFLLQGPSSPEMIEQVAEAKMLNVYLKDGSTVKLEKGSKISYASDFHEQDERIIHLEGQATFDIFSNPDKKLLVNTKESVIEVIGTIFKVDATESFTKVSVQEGTVSFSSAKDPNKKILLNQGDVGELTDGAMEKMEAEPALESDETELEAPQVEEIKELPVAEVTKEVIKEEPTKVIEPEKEVELPKANLSKFRLDDVLNLLDDKYKDKFTRHRKCKVKKNASVRVDLMMDLDEIVKQIAVEYEMDIKKTCPDCYEIRSVKEK